jgi:hypothetical protein
MVDLDTVDAVARYLDENPADVLAYRALCDEYMADGDNDQVDILTVIADTVAAAVVGHRGAHLVPVQPGLVAVPVFETISLAIFGRGADGRWFFAGWRAGDPVTLVADVDGDPAMAAGSTWVFRHARGASFGRVSLRPAQGDTSVRRVVPYAEFARLVGLIQL